MAFCVHESMECILIVAYKCVPYWFELLCANVNSCIQKETCGSVKQSINI